MIENHNQTKTVDDLGSAFTRYIGVATIKVLGINPGNKELREYGWSIADDADEPVYVTDKVLPDGTSRRTMKVRFMCKIMDLKEQPVIPVDFRIGPDIIIGTQSNKVKIIDVFGNTAWGTKEEVQNRLIPNYTTGPATIEKPYRPCHRGEEEIVSFLQKLLYINPYKVKDKKTGNWVKAANPGKLAIDNWQALCNGDVTELFKMHMLEPDNTMKIVLGINCTDENKIYQTFLNTRFYSSMMRSNNGKYDAVEAYLEKNAQDGYEFSADIVHVYSEEPTEVKPSNTSVDDMPDFEEEMMGNQSSENQSSSPLDDLPFGDSNDGFGFDDFK